MSGCGCNGDEHDVLCPVAVQARFGRGLTRVANGTTDEKITCGCEGYYHNGGCSDQNVIFWMDANGKLPKGGIPVNPTDEEIRAQLARKQPRDFVTATMRVKVRYLMDQLK